MALPWILIGVFVLLVLLAVIAFIVNKNKGKKYQPDYYAFFIMGIAFFAIGMGSSNSALWILGLVFFALGIANKDKWKKNHKTWKQLDKNDKKIRLILIIGLVIFLILGIIVYFLSRQF